MNITFLGGADEVGASCTLIRVAGKNILVDAGLRMASRHLYDNLPDFVELRNRLSGKPIDAVIVTHAHIDHIGSLPHLMSEFGHWESGSLRTPIYMTPPTIGLSSILLNDSSRIIAQEANEQQVDPIYTGMDVRAALSAVRTIPYDTIVEIASGVNLSFYPAGHILGAACAYVETREGTILFGGDISGDGQIAVPGHRVPKLDPDYIVVESTYGGRYHSNREGEFVRIVERIERVIEAQGVALFPAFAVGRSQEILMILSQAIEEGRMTRVPIYVDGMVRSVCKAYSTHREYSTPLMQERIQKYGSPFFYHGSPIVSVSGPSDRAAIAQERPAIVVASSGMLTGGASLFYAEAIASDPNSLVAITGYQDEESPGRRVQELAKSGGGHLRIGDRKIHFRCQVETYGLSAHADTYEIAQFVEAQQAKVQKVFLVHGDHRARCEVRNRILPQLTGGAEVEMPHIGEAFVLKNVEPDRPLALPVDRRRHPASAGELRHAAEVLLQRDGPQAEYTIQEILGVIDPLMGHHLPNIDQVVRHMGVQFPFRPSRRNVGMYRVRSIVRTNTPTDQHGIMEQNQAREVAQRLLEPYPSAYKIGFDRTKYILTIFCDYETDEEAFNQIVEDVEESTRWAVEVKVRPRKEQLVALLASYVPPSWDVVCEPSVDLSNRMITLTVREVAKPIDKMGFSVRLFTEQTGWNVQIRWTLRANMGFALPRPQSGAQEPMEYNACYGAIRRRFAGEPHQPLRVGYKDDRIEVRFISSRIGERYMNILHQLREEVGRPVVLCEYYNPQEVARRLREVLVGAVRTLGHPAIRPTLTISVELVDGKERDVLPSLAEKFFEETGYCLQFTIDEEVIYEYKE